MMQAQNNSINLVNHTMISSNSILQTVDDRKRQINTLKVFNDNVSTLKENEEYAVKFYCGENKLVMLVLLSNDFPNEKPLLKISPAIKHTWVNENSEIISAPGYLNFSVYSDLGRVVQAIIQELQRNPPVLASPSNIYISALSKGDTIPNVKDLISPDIFYTSEVAAKLRDTPTAELRILNESDDYLDEFMSSLSNISNSRQIVTDLMSATEQLAKENLAYESRLQNLNIENMEKEEILKIHENRLLELHDRYKVFEEERSPENIKKMLCQAAVEADKQSEVLGEQFLDGEVPITQFLSEYSKLRMMVHIRNIKAGKPDYQFEGCILY